MTTPINLLQGQGLEGVADWNSWRADNPDVRPDCRHANLNGSILQGADLHDTHLGGVLLREANLYGADLRRASLREAVLVGANLNMADLTAADLTYANLAQCTMNEGTNIQDAKFSGARVYGLAAWDLVGHPASQSNLIITLSETEPSILVDNLEMAQFIHVLLNNSRIRDVLDTVTSKVVLILGRFSEERKHILDAIRADLRHRNLVPVLFDFARPSNKDLTGTVETLSRLARFIIADLTDPRSVPHELATIVPQLRTTPVVPLQLTGSEGYGMFRDLKAYPWVLAPYDYADMDSLIASLGDIVLSAENMFVSLRDR